MSSQFDPSAFLDATTTEAATRRPPLPVGPYQGTIEDLTSRQWQGKPGGKAEGKSGIAFDVKIRIPTAGLKDQPESILMNDSIMVDTTDSGSMDWAPGANRQLRRYREALNMNESGKAFAPRMMVGRTILVNVKHELYEGELYERVDSVAKG